MLETRTRAHSEKERYEHLTGSDFSFAADDVVQVLSRESVSDLVYVGSACSHFQAEPLVRDTDGALIVTSDWEIEVVKNIQGKPSKISGSQRPEDFPQFLKKKRAYVARSAEMGRKHVSVFS